MYVEVTLRKTDSHNVIIFVLLYYITAILNSLKKEIKYVVFLKKGVYNFLEVSVCIEFQIISNFMSSQSFM